MAELMMTRTATQAVREERATLWSLFKDVLSANDKYRDRYFSQVWEDVAPSGNIYKRNAIYLEHRYHSMDLWKQMSQLAEKHRPLLEGDRKRSIEECMEVLYDELVKTTIHIPKDDADEAPETITGYPPIDEFLSDKVEKFGPFLMYMDKEKRAEEIKHRLVALNVFLLQTLAPALIFFNRWGMPSNQVKRLLGMGHRSLKNKLKIAELLCLGPTFEDACTTLLGVQLLFAVIFITRCFVDQQVGDAHKWQRLPHSAWWLFMDVFANTWCVSFIMFGIPLLFWSEETPTNMVLDSMTLLFLFNVDNLTDVLCSYIGMSQEDFQRTVSSMTAFLSHCPVDLEKVINPNAKTKEELWQIKLDGIGKLIGVDGIRCTSRLHFSVDQEEPFQHAPEPRQRFTNYGTTTLPKSVALPTEKIQVVCHRSREEDFTLPSPFTVALISVWDIFAWIVWIGNIVIPITWYLLNKPCFFDETNHRVSTPQALLPHK
mmetsp:Transcript_13862/g.24381  ORF Transcript_13862/g.24381 Transcript_13862/m.24381 type:complete len:486 (-) Transcript_13862:86-1543(-)